MGFIKYLVAIVLTVLFTIALSTFAMNFGVDNNSDVKLIDDLGYTELNKTLRGNLTLFYGDANTSVGEMDKTTISSITETAESGAAIKVTILTALPMLYSIIKQVFTTVFGSGEEFEVIVTTLIAILGIIGVAYLYKAIAGRNPD